MKKKIRFRPKCRQKTGANGSDFPCYPLKQVFSPFYKNCTPLEKCTFLNNVHFCTPLLQKYEHGD